MRPLDMPKSARFVSYCYILVFSTFDLDIQSMLADKDSKSTKKATKQAVEILREYCAEKELPTEFENIYIQNKS